MTPGLGEPTGEPEADESLGVRRRRQLLRLMGARLVLSIAILGAALALVGVREGAESSERGLYGTMAGAFLATVVYALGFRRVSHGRHFSWAQVGTDVTLVTSLVYFSGGKDSVFTFLYVPIVVYAAQLFGRPGAYASASLATLAYGAALWAVDVGWLPLLTEPGSTTPWLALWGLHAGAWLLVALLASKLSRELHRTGRELDRRNTDLRRLQRLHERTVESLTSGLLTTDPSGRITSFNPEAERITGLVVSKALGREVEEVLPGVRQAVLEAAVRSTGKLRVRMPYRRGEGEELHLGVSACVLRDPDAEHGGYVVIFQDVSDVVRMEANLRRSERLAAVGQLAAGMAHEVRNPLAAISGSIQMLRASLGSEQAGGEGIRLMGIVLRETDRLDGLIREFLGFARPAPPKFETIQLAGLVSELLEVFGASCPAGVAVIPEVPPGLGVRADGAQLRQVLWNLLLNAVQALPPAGGEVRLAGRAIPDPAQEGVDVDRNEAGMEGEAWVEISVADTGTGMAPEVLERIFEPFFTTRAGGSGLGLATVHRIVEANRGILRVESRPGAGSVFRVVLPGAEVPS